MSEVVEAKEFVYDKLPDSTENKASYHAIRLLKFCEDSRFPVIRCTLETYSYDSCPEYFAISYTWGAADPLFPIYVNGRRFLIRGNLFAFMVTPQRTEIYLWIDQICINQEDVSERNNQVQRMGDYYSRAQGVLAWLGEGTALELDALDHMIQAREVRRDSLRREKPMGLELLRGYVSIISKAYFKRLWVVQELARAKSIVLLLADRFSVRIVHWHHFVVAFTLVRAETIINSKDTVQAQEEIRLRLQLREHTIPQELMKVKEKEYEVEIFELIKAFSHFECADLRDKLYALRGIANLKQQLFHIDYGKSVERVYWDFLAACSAQLGPDGKLTDRHIDSLAKLATEMKARIIPPFGGLADEGGGNAAPSTSACTPGNAALLLRSLYYSYHKDVRRFGQFYDKETGDHLLSTRSLSSEVEYAVGTNFRIPNSADMDSFLRTQREKLAQLTDVSLSLSSVLAWQTRSLLTAIKTTG